MSKIKASILLVEDDQNLGFVVRDVLQLNGYEVDWQKDGTTGIKSFFEKGFDLCILDVMLPSKDGFTVATELRELDKDIPIIFLTAKTMQDDRIKGYKAGADDYITKPFSTEEFLLRVEAVLKRCFDNGQPTGRKDVFNIGNYVFDYANQTLTIGKNERTLTKREADVLKLLFINRNEVLARETALRLIWGSDDYFTGRSMDVFITRLRKYLKEDPEVTIDNVHGVGFKMVVR